MKFVNDKGLSTPERLYAIGDMLKANFQWVVYNTEIPKSNFPYSISLLRAGEGEGYSFAEGEQVSVGQSVLWGTNEEIYLAVINSFDLEKEEITLGNVTRWQGEQGQMGENGKEPLLYALIYSSSIEVKPTNTYALPIGQFNRTPVVLEFINGLIVTWDDTSGASSIKHSYECIARVMAVTATNVTISITSVVETTGQQGPQGTLNEDQINTIKLHVLKTIYTIGAYYITESMSNPAAILGFGTWTPVQGKFLIGQSTSDGLMPGSEGGEKTHTLTEAEMPQHSHKPHQFTWVVSYGGNTGKNSINGANQGNANVFNADEDQNRYTGTAGGNQPHNNMPPYRVVFIWRRTA